MCIYICVLGIYMYVYVYMYGFFVMYGCAYMFILLVVYIYTHTNIYIHHSYPPPLSFQSSNIQKRSVLAMVPHAIGFLSAYLTNKCLILPSVVMDRIDEATQLLGYTSTNSSRSGSNTVSGSGLTVEKLKSAYIHFNGSKNSKINGNNGSEYVHVSAPVPRVLGSQY